MSTLYKSRVLFHSNNQALRWGAIFMPERREPMISALILLMICCFECQTIERRACVLPLYICYKACAYSSAHSPLIATVKLRFTSLQKR